MVVVGASLAGSTAAAFLGRAGARVVLVERAPDPDAYKVACTHSVQACAMPTLSRLGLVEEIEAAGAVPNAIHMRTPYGWIRPEGTADEPLPVGFNLRRASMDPVLRRAAAASPNVTLEAGATVTDLLRDSRGRPAGIRARLSSGEHRELHTRAVVAADGRDSTVGRLARVPARIHENARFGYFAQFRGVRLPNAAASVLWFGNPDMGYAFRNEDGITVLAAMPHRARLPEFKADPEGSLMGHLRAVPDGPDLTDAERITPVIGRLRSPCTIRPAGRPGIGFVGDAAMASDPLWGVGCGFAFQTGDWLAQELAGPIARGEDETQIDAALARYARRHRRALAGHQALMNDYASGRRFSLVERLLFSAAARDAITARHLHTLGSRMRPPQRILPAALTRAAVVKARGAGSSSGSAGRGLEYA